MRMKVREVEPRTEARDLEELVVEDQGSAASADAGARIGGEAPPEREPNLGLGRVHQVGSGRSPTAADLGPNGDVVLDILARAERLTADEAHGLEREASWRWGFLGIAATLTGPAGTSLPVARAVALNRGRADGRAEAITALTAAVAGIMRNRPSARSRAVLAAAVANAGLAVLVRDLIDVETFEVLFGPWREVMHH